jgi:peptidoglycan/xylan/chitin deacetylase (PgdA/CDA1 family)
MKRVTLTFDNGPTPGITERVLEILDRAGLRCSFFVIGQKLAAPAAAALMRQAHAAGHWIGNHTLTHATPFGLRPDAAFAAGQIDETQALIGACARPEKLFRPYGDQGRIGPHLLSAAAVAHLLAGRFCVVTWNNVPGDWKDQDGWVAHCLAGVRTQDWSVVVLHDIANGCLEHLPELLRRLEDLGVTFEQGFPDSVVLMRDGQALNLDPGLIAPT